jgi:hypothetical protein
MKKIIVLSLISFLWMNFAFKDKKELLSRKWLMVEMTVAGSTYSEDFLENQRKKGLVTILEFSENGTSYVHTKTPKGKTTRRNRWAFSTDEMYLTIQPQDEDGDAQSFKIEKLTAKRLILTMDDKGGKQRFVYKEYKE